MKRLEKMRDELADKRYCGKEAYFGSEESAFCEGFDAATKELMRVIEIQTRAIYEIKAFNGLTMSQIQFISDIQMKAGAILSGEKE